MADPCGAWGGCVLPAGHNMGNVDVPENHKVPPHTHDPLCPVVTAADFPDMECRCVWIRLGRDDERDRWRKPCDCPIAFHEAEVRERLRAQVEALTTLPLGGWDVVFLKDVLAMLDGASNG